MTIQLVSSRTISSDATAVSAVSVGDNKWVVECLRGRTLTLGQALAAIQLAEVLPHPRPASDDDPLWTQVIGWLDEFGMGRAPLTVAGVLGVPCLFAPLPVSRGQHQSQSSRRRFPRWLAR